MTWTVNINGHDDLTGDEKVAYEEAVVEKARALAAEIAGWEGGHWQPLTPEDVRTISLMPQERAREHRRARRLRRWKPERVWDMAAHKGWGNRIAWSGRDGYTRKRIDGHTSPRPRVDDEIRWPMTSGRTMRGRLVEVEYCRDPHDMWFATVEEIGYLDESPDAPPVTRRSVFV